MIDSLDKSDRPVKIVFCESFKPTGFQMFYGSDSSVKVGPLHGYYTSIDQCTGHNLTSKVNEISFYGNSAPFYDGIKMTLEDGTTITTGKVDQAGQQKRSKSYPAQNDDGDYVFDFFGFQTAETSNGSLVTINSIDLVSFDEVDFVTNKETIEN